MTPDPEMRYIEDDEALRQVAASLSDASLLALDTEAAGFHRYRDQICLVQLSTRSRTFVIDALAVSSLEPLAGALAAPSTETILHDADYDLRLLERDHDMRVARLFDTKIAAQIVGEPAIGLGNLVEKYLDVRLDKKHQRADWAARPLPTEMLEYAASDTRHLPELRDILLARLEELGRLHWAQEEFQLIERASRAPTDNGEAYRRLKNTFGLARRQLAALRSLYAWREDVARERDSAPFRVVPNNALVQVATELPTSLDTLSATGIPARVAKRYGQELVDAVRTALALPESELPERAVRRRRPPPDPEFDRLVDRLRALRDSASDLLGIDRGFLLPRQQIEHIVRAKPQDRKALEEMDEVKNWQVEALGDDILKVLSNGSGD